MADTENWNVFKSRSWYMIWLCVLWMFSLTGKAAPVTRWFKPPDPARRILPRAVRLPPGARKPKLNLLVQPGLSWRVEIGLRRFSAPKGFPCWSKADSRRQKLVNARCQNSLELRDWINGPDGQKSTTPEIVANAALILLGVSCTLLYRQIERLAEDFENFGGFTERLYQIRKQKQTKK